MIEGVTIGPFVFDYDPNNREMFISTDEETKAMAESIPPECWEQFVETVLSKTKK